MKNRHAIIAVILLFLLVGCGYFQTEESDTYVARVNNVYLTQEELVENMPEDLSGKDSLLWVKNYIKRWGTKQLLLEGAKRNLPQKKQREFNALVQEYQRELYIEAFKNMLIATNIDTLVTAPQLKAYYKKNKKNFKLQEDLAKLRYLKLSRDIPAIDKIKQHFKRFNAADQEKLEQESLKFLIYSLSDSTWVSIDKLEKRIPLLRQAKEDNFETGDFVVLKDSSNVFMIAFTDVRRSGEQAPYQYIKPVLKQVIINRRKIEFGKELEKEITKDALDDNTFEIYK